MIRLLVALLIIWSTQAVAAEDQLLPPEPWTREVFGSPSLPPPLFSRLSEIPIAQFCQALGASEPLANLPPSDDKCSFETNRFFVFVRPSGDGVGTARIKLNSTPEKQAEDLEILVTFSKSLFENVGWPLPQSLQDAMAAGSRYSCQTGFLRYDFSRERGEVPRFNLIVRLDGAQPSSSAFGSWLMPCSS